ncbi:hypothetical protein GJ496_004583 [Pomphorhynchus laevis]|nr:hypothetical protein GJ496_004583 [Pomphorhynchus laevis]
MDKHGLDELMNRCCLETGNRQTIVTSNSPKFGAIIRGNEIVSRDEANRKWIEFDKGLQTSNSIGTNVHTLMLFPDFFNEFRLPEYINSGFMRLASIFRVCSNHLRWHVANTFIASKEHWDMVSNVSDIFRMLVSIMYSNDLLARALTLVVIDTMSQMKGDVVPLHQILLYTFEKQIKMSKYQICFTNELTEYVATLRACKRFCSSSRSFSENILEIIRSTNINESSSIPDIARVLCSMKLTVNGAFEVFKVYQEFINDFSADNKLQEYCVKSLAKCAALNASLISHLIKLFITKSIRDPNSCILLTFIRAFYYLLKKNFQMCKSSLIMHLIWLTLNSENDCIRHESILLAKLVYIKSEFKLSISIDRIKQLECLMFDVDVFVCINACHIYFGVSHVDCLNRQFEFEDDNLYSFDISLLLTAISSVFELTLLAQGGGSYNNLKLVASTVTLICMTSVFNSQSIVTKFCHWIDDINDDFITAVFESICFAIKQCHKMPKQSSNHVLANELLSRWDRFTNSTIQSQASFLLWIGINYIQLSSIELIKRLFASPVDLYRFGKLATRFCAFHIACECFKQLADTDVPFCYSTMFTSINHACLAENHVRQFVKLKSTSDYSNLMLIRQAIIEYGNAIWFDQLSSLQDQTFSCQKQYFQCRRDLLSIAMNLYNSISSIEDTETYDCNAFDNQLLLSCFFDNLNLLYRHVQAMMCTMFDADIHSVSIVDRQYRQIAFIDFCTNGYLQTGDIDNTQEHLERFGEFCPNLKTLNIQERMRMIKQFVENEIFYCDPFPSAIFQRLQRTQIQIYIDPQLSSQVKPICIKSLEDFSLSIQGFFTYNHCRYPDRLNTHLNKVTKVYFKVYVNKVRTDRRPDENHIPSDEITQSSIMSSRLFRTNAFTDDQTDVQVCHNSFEVETSVSKNEGYFCSTIVIQQDIFTAQNDTDMNHSSTKSAKYKKSPKVVKPTYAIKVNVDYEDQFWRRWSNQAGFTTYVKVL